MAIGRVKTGNELLDRFLGAIVDELTALAARFIPKDRPKVVDFTAANTDVLVPHGLGRPITGYNVIRISAGGVVYEGSAVAAPYTSSNFINLKSSAIAKATVVFF